MAKKNKNDKKTFSRRKFLQRGAIILGGVVAATYLGRGPARRFLAKTISDMDVASIISTFQPDFWFEVQPDNTILMKSPKVEMGQGIFTGFAMLAAEELEVALEQMRVEHADTVTGPVDKMNTGGSNSTSSLFIPIREVAATMREMLKLAAAAQWSIDAGNIKVENGVMTAGNRSMTYAEASQSTAEWKVPKTPPLKPASAFKYVGREMKRIDLVPKVMGEPIFGIDHSFPNMLYAVILQTPLIGGMLQSANTADAEAHPGVVKVLREKDWIAVVAESRYAAETGLNLIEAEWDAPKKWQQAEVEALVTVGQGREVNIQNDGNARSALSQSENRTFRQEYRTPIAVHAQMEPNGTVAWVEKDKATVIIGTQGPGMIQGMVAKALGMKSTQVTVKTAYLGGGFGRRLHVNNAGQAAVISRAVGRPVHVFNTREQEFLNAHYRPNTHHVLEAAISPDGDITAITHAQATPDFVIKSVAGDFGMVVAGADFISAGHGARFIYNVPNRSAALWHSDHPLRTGIWRSVGMFANTFAIESFMNELAHETGKDPLAMRLELVAGSETINRRYVKVLETLAEKSAWNSPKPEGIGRGVAMGDDRKGIAAAVIEVALSEAGSIRVTKVTHVTDSGLCVNPDGIRMQVEGCIMMGITAALYEEITLKDGRITASNFHAYPMATLKDTPEIEIVIVEGADQPYGVGEPPLAPIAPAIAAAVFDLTQRRFRSLPILGSRNLTE